MSATLAGMWWDANGDWKRANESAQEDSGPEGGWVHAATQGAVECKTTIPILSNFLFEASGDRLSIYPHRKEGDQENAAYWYARAGKPVCQEHLDAEWGCIVKALPRGNS